MSLSGQDFYLGPHGTKFSKGEYDRVVAEWLARGRCPLVDHDDAAAGEITLVELAARYKAFAKGYYRKNGVVTNEYTAVVNALKVACGSYGREPASAFGPLKLQSRSTSNDPARLESQTDQQAGGAHRSRVRLGSFARRSSRMPRMHCAK